MITKNLKLKRIIINTILYCCQTLELTKAVFNHDHDWSFSHRINNVFGIDIDCTLKKNFVTTFLSNFFV